MTRDPFDLKRFVVAQTDVYGQALEELRAGRKQSHWMWFIFPQLAGLGRSPTAKFFGLSSLDEARAYLKHAVLAPRLAICTQAVLDLDGTSLREIFGSPDDMKFRSSMTVFALASEHQSNLFLEAVTRYCNDGMDQATIDILRRQSRSAK